MNSPIDPVASVTSSTAVSQVPLVERMKAETSLRSRFDLLRAERQDWERNEVARANTRRDELLVETYRLLLEAQPGELRALAEHLDIDMNSATGDAALAVKIVFGDKDRRRASKFGQVLGAALAYGLKNADGLLDWIKRGGGIEKIRLGKPNADGETPLDIGKKLAVEKATTTAPLMVVPATIAADIKSNADGFVVHLSRRNGESGLDILYSLNAEAVLSAVFKEIAKLAEKQAGMGRVGEDAAGIPANQMTVEVTGTAPGGLRAATEEAVNA